MSWPPIANRQRIAVSPLHPDHRLAAMAGLTSTLRTMHPITSGCSTPSTTAASGMASPRTQGTDLSESDRTLDLVTQAIADGMALGVLAPGDARQAASVLWAAVNGTLALLAHPIRRALSRPNLRIYIARRWRYF